MTATASPDAGRRARLTATTPVQFLPGVGPGRAALLARLGLNTLEDLLLHVPREYLDARRTVPVALTLGCRDQAAVQHLLLTATLARPLMEPMPIGAALAHYDRPLPSVAAYDTLLSPEAAR